MNQHVMPKLNRRAFVIGTAAVGAGLALGLDIPFGGPTVVRAADGSPEVNAWVVIRPDDTVVIRIARSEMGQGTLTGLAQLVAEELECDWSKVTTEFPTPGQSVARKRAWGDFSTGGSRGIRASAGICPQGRRHRAHDADPGRRQRMEGAGLGMHRGQQRHHAHAASGKTTTYGKVAEAAARLEPPADVKLKDPKDWKIAGKGVKRLDTADKTTGKMIYGIDVKLPGMLNAAIKDCPVFGGKLKSFDEAKITGMKGVKKVVRVGDNAVAVVADTWWHAKTALDALPIVWDEGENAKVSSESIAKWLAEGLDNSQPAFVGNQNGDAKAAIASAAKKVEAVYNYPYQNHATHGAAERHGALHGGQMRGLVRHAKWRGGVRGDAGGVRPAGRQMRRAQADARRRLRPARPDRLRPPGGSDRQADAGHADQAALVARRGHARTARIIRSRSAN